MKTALVLVDECLVELTAALGSLEELKMCTAMEIDMYFNLMVVFSFVWAAGGNIYDSLINNGQNKWSKTIKSKIMSFYTNFPFEGDVQDYYVDWKHREFRHWKELIP